jgi:hypothetical protein
MAALLPACRATRLSVTPDAGRAAAASRSDFSPFAAGYDVANSAAYGGVSTIVSVANMRFDAMTVLPWCSELRLGGQEVGRTA